MWRGVVGVDGGNVDVSRNKRIGRSAARLASYLSKYISKSLGWYACARGHLTLNKLERVLARLSASRFVVRLCPLSPHFLLCSQTFIQRWEREFCLDRRIHNEHYE
jgi:hypothetical protein